MQPRKRALIAAAVLSVLGGGAHAFGGNVYWDINGTADGSGATAGVASGAWDGVNMFWNSDPTGGAAGTLTSDVGATNTGVFSAGTDATGTSQVTLLGGNTVTIGGLQLVSGNVPITTSGGSGSGILSMPNATTTIDVAAGSTLSFGINANPILLSGSGLIVKTGAGTLFNNNNIGTFTGKWDITGGVMQILNGNTPNEFGVPPATFTADEITLDGGTLQTVNNTSAQFGTTRGITIGPNGGTFDIEGNTAGVGSVSFNGKITGTAGITVEGKGIAFSFVDNSSSYTGKWTLTGGETNPNVGGADVGLGAVPGSYEADAVTFNGGSMRVSAAMTIPANRGLTMGAGGGRLHAVSSATLTVNSIITGGGPLTINLLGEAGAPGHVVLNAAENYTGSTTVAAGTLDLVGSLTSNTVIVPVGGGTLNVSGSLSWATALSDDVVVNLTNASQTLAALTSVGSSGALNLNGPTQLTVDSGSFSGNITGNMANLTKDTAGLLALYGNNSYGGTTTITGGTLLANSTASLPGYNFVKIHVNSGGTVAASAGGAGQWDSGTIDTLINNNVFASGSAAGINVDASNTFTYSSNITQPIGFTKLGAGTLDLEGSNTYTGPTTVSGGKLILGQSLTTSSAIVVSSGAIAQVAAGNNKIIKTPSVSITGTGQLDLVDNKLAVVGGTLGTWNGSAYSGVTGLVQSGRNGGAWNGGGIVTSQTAAVGSTPRTTLGVALAGDIGKTSLNGVSVSPADVLVMYTYAGDANLSGAINGDDYFRIDQGYATRNNPTPLLGYENGDFNYDGRIDADDYFIIDSNYSKQGTAFTAGAPVGGSVGGVTAVPEPAGIALLGVAIFAAGRRRRRAN